MGPRDARAQTWNARGATCCFEPLAPSLCLEIPFEIVPPLAFSNRWLSQTGGVEALAPSPPKTQPYPILSRLSRPRIAAPRLAARCCCNQPLAALEPPPAPRASGGRGGGVKTTSSWTFPIRGSTLPHPELHVQTALSRAMPCYAPLRQAAAKRWGRRERRG
jgi:hypothetical protein